MRKKMAHFQKNYFLLSLAAILSVFFVACGGGGGGGGTPAVAVPFSVPAGVTVRIAKIDTNCPELTALVSVNDDQSATPVVGLTDQNFRVFDGSGTELILKNSNELGIPEPILFSLAMDYSLSLSDADVADMEAATATFIDDFYTLTLDPSYGQILKFATRSEITQDFTNVPADLVTAAGTPFTFRGENLTALYDAIGKALEEVRDFRLGAGAPADIPEQSFVIVLTDGEDTNSQTYLTVDQLIDLAVQHNIKIVTIGFGQFTNPQVLSKLALDTGGLYIPAANAGDLSNSLTQLIDNLKQFYSMSFDDAGGVPQVIEIQVTTPAGLTGSDTLDYTCP